MIRTMVGEGYTLPELARALGLNYTTLWTRVYCGKSVPEPDLKVGKRAYYTPAAFERIVELLGSARNYTDVR